jgi:hypothetical protein
MALIRGGRDRRRLRAHRRMLRSVSPSLNGTPERGESSPDERMRLVLASGLGLAPGRAVAGLDLIPGVP